MKKVRLEKVFLEELAKVPIIALACNKVGLSRQSIYRWMKENDKFKEKVEIALTQGIESISDLAESKLITHISNGNMRAIQYWLENNKNKYYRPKKAILPEEKNYKGVTSITFNVVDENGETKSSPKLEDILKRNNKKQ